MFSSFIKSVPLGKCVVKLLKIISDSYYLCRNEKKVIVNKFVQPSAVTCLSWPFDDKILVGQLDGKVR